MPNGYNKGIQNTVSSCIGTGHLIVCWINADAETTNSHQPITVLFIEVEVLGKIAIYVFDTKKSKTVWYDFSIKFIQCRSYVWCSEHTHKQSESYIRCFPAKAGMEGGRSAKDFFCRTTVQCPPPLLHHSTTVPQLLISISNTFSNIVLKFYKLVSWQYWLVVYQRTAF